FAWMYRLRAGVATGRTPDRQSRQKRCRDQCHLNGMNVRHLFTLPHQIAVREIGLGIRPGEELKPYVTR
ncbi:MAG: hypothetical protein QF713_05950, partial [Dehalococcoidales bacterium]|nr:hypothetical protein [Dehalococcoidales bacterium]